MTDMDEYINILCRRLRLVRFVSGEPNLKVDAIHRLTCVLGVHTNPNPEELLKVCDLMRIFIMDWDRTVRACAFRCLRYALNARSECLEEKLVETGVHDLAVARLEACKSSTERAAILRFISLWLSTTKSEIVVRRFVESILELVLAMGAATQNTTQSELTSVLFSITAEAAYRFPVACFFPIQRASDSLATCLRTVDGQECISVIKFLSLHVQVMPLPGSLLTVEVFSDLLGSEIGVSILSRSLELSQLTTDEFLEVLIGICPLPPLLENLIIPFRDELVENLISSNRFRFLSIFKTVDTCGIDWKYPEWVKDRIEASTSGLTSRRALSRRSSLASNLAPTVSLLVSDSSTSSNAQLEEIIKIIEGKQNPISKWKSLSDHLMNRSPRNPVLLEFLVSEISRLAIEDDANSNIFDITAIAKLPSIQSDLLWLLAIKSSEERTAQAIESGWLDDRWDKKWIDSVNPFLCDLSLNSQVFARNRLEPSLPSTAGIWTLNGLELRPSIMRRIPHDRKMIPKPSDSLTREIMNISPLAQRHQTVLLDDPLFAFNGVHKIGIDSRTKFDINVNDSVVTESLVKNCYSSNGKTLTEFLVGSIAFVFEVQDAGFGLVAILKPSDGGLAERSQQAWERGVHFLACIASTNEGVSLLRSTKMSSLEKSVALAKDNTHALWLVGGLLLSKSEAAWSLASDLGVIEVIHAIVSSRPVAFSNMHLFTAVRMANMAGLTLPSLELLSGKSIPSTVPTLPKLPPKNDSSNQYEAFTEAHLELLADLDSLASSVHFKQKSAALAAKKQKNGALFQSVPLWYAVMDRMTIGRYSLQVRRLIHSLFVHTICDEKSMEVYDSLLS